MLYVIYIKIKKTADFHTYLNDCTVAIQLVTTCINFVLQFAKQREDIIFDIIIKLKTNHFIFNIFDV